MDIRWDLVVGFGIGTVVAIVNPALACLVYLVAVAFLCGQFWGEGADSGSLRQRVEEMSKSWLK